jgi:hypothetical protein
LRKPALRLRGGQRGSGVFPPDGFGPGTGAAAQKLLALLYFGVFPDCLLVICRRLAFFETDGPCGARGEAIAEAVAVIVAQKLCLSVRHADRPFMAGFGAKAAAVAFIFIDFDNFSDHGYSNLLAFGCYFD